MTIDPKAIDRFLDERPKTVGVILVGILLPIFALFAAVLGSAIGLLYDLLADQVSGLMLHVLVPTIILGPISMLVFKRDICAALLKRFVACPERSEVGACLDQIFAQEQLHLLATSGIDRDKLLPRVQITPRVAPWRVKVKVASLAERPGNNQLREVLARGLRAHYSRWQLACFAHADDTRPLHINEPDLSNHQKVHLQALTKGGLQDKQTCQSAARS